MSNVQAKASPKLFGRNAANEKSTTGDSGEFASRSGLLPRQNIQLMANRKMIQATAEIDNSQYQPASMDLRLGS
jgi:hypothetical protein